MRIFHVAKSSRPIASLTISFGLLSIPVQLFSATVPSERISFHLLCKSDGSRGKEHVVIIRANGNRLALRQLHFEGEMRKPEDFGRDATRVSEAEVNLARQLIDQLTTDRFDRDEFVDQHRAWIQAEIKIKIHGKDITPEEPQLEKRSDNVINLMDALWASLRGGGRIGRTRRAQAPSKRGRKAA